MIFINRSKREGKGENRARAREEQWYTFRNHFSLLRLRSVYALSAYECEYFCTSLFVCRIDRLFYSLYSSVLKVLVHLHLCCQSVFYFCFCFRSEWTDIESFKGKRCSLSLLIKRNIVIYLLNAIESIVTLYVCTFGWLTSFSLFNWCFFLYFLGLDLPLPLCHGCVYVIYTSIASMKNCGWDDRVLFESINSLTNPAHDRCGKNAYFFHSHSFICLLARSLVRSAHAIFCCSVPIYPPQLVRVSFSFSNSSVMFFVEWFSQFI